MTLPETREAMESGTLVCSNTYSLQGTGPYVVTAIVYTRTEGGRILAGAKLQSPNCSHSFVVENPRRLRVAEQ